MLNCAAQKNAALLTEIPFRMYTGGVISIEARLDSHSRPLNFILDTGSSGISLDSATCVEFNLKQQQTDTTVGGIAGRKKVPFVFDQKLLIPGLLVERLNFYVNDYAVLTAVYGEKIDGIIGYGMFSRFIIAVNYDTALIKIFSPGKLNYGAGTTLRPRINFLPIQNLTVRDKRKVKFPFYMDSGAGLCFLMSQQFAKDSNIVMAKRRPVITQTEGLGGKKQMQLTVIRQLRLGPYSFKNVPTYMYDDEMNITSYPSTGGLLGNDIMRRFNVTYNYPANEIFIVPNRQFHDDFDYAYTGLLIYQINDGIFAEDIVTGSPAEIAGMRVNDEIIGINNNFSGNINKYSALLQKAKEKVNVLVKRSGQLRIIVIEPVSILR